MDTVKAVLGVSDHTGWAVFVTAVDGAVIDRRRVAIKDDALPALPHHSQGQRLPIDEAVALVERVRGSAERHSALRLEELAREVKTPIVAIALRACPKLPETTAEQIQDYWAQTRADGVMYRRALARAAAGRGWRVFWFERPAVFDQASTLLGQDFETLNAAEKSRLGTPWTQDHRLALAGALATTF